MRIAIITMATAAVLTGCITSKPVALPDGTQGVAIRCPGHARDISDCMNEAAKICGGKYQMVDRETGTGLGIAQPLGNGAIYGNAMNRTLIVKCGAS